PSCTMGIMALPCLTVQVGKIKVNGILGGSVVLSVDLSPRKKVKEIEWSFSAGTGVTIQLAEFSGGKFERMDPGDRFQQRLEMYNETSLQIQALELGDSGVYEARIKIVPATVEDRTFLLRRVSEPQPTHSLSRTADGCNVTLQCHASGREEVNVSWTRGNPPLNSTFTCTASNPGDQKSISPDLQSICQSASELSAGRVCLLAYTGFISVTDRRTRSPESGINTVAPALLLVHVRCQSSERRWNLLPLPGPFTLRARSKGVVVQTGIQAGPSDPPDSVFSPLQERLPVLAIGDPLL
uniref:Ig-like domain-containing protein n=1 Tax=Chelydra serpentina TaxID=8475 RepID=A0A8C3RUS6_CHESE